MKLLLKHCDIEYINYTYFFNDTPLVAASRLGHTDIGDLRNGETLLCETTGAGHVDIVDLLIKYGIDCNKSNECVKTPLCGTSCASYVNTVALLIKCGANCNKSGMTISTWLRIKTPGPSTLSKN